MTEPQTSLNERVAAEIRAEMGRARIKQSHLARELGRSDMYVSRRLTGEVAFDMAEVETIAGILGVPVSRFLAAASERVA